MGFRAKLVCLLKGHHWEVRFLNPGDFCRMATHVCQRCGKGAEHHRDLALRWQAYKDTRP